MKKICVKVKDKNTVVLDEDARRGDYIDLRELNILDYSDIESLIEQGKDSIYNKKLEEYKYTIKLENEKEITNTKISYENIINDLNKQILLLNIEKENLLKQKDDRINEILRQKASLNVKQTGENLEAWCNNEVISYMQNGLFNCTWNKDNEAIKLDGEGKGSKADYIFKVFASSAHEESELLASLCLEMKDENPDSVNKKSNSDYYKQLDRNRVKKNCKYAVLVSSLESDKPNDLPMFRVNEYEDMYVVRPAYLMTFLNIIVSLVTKFKDLVIEDNKEKLALKNYIDLMDEFNALKSSYLDKPLENLEKSIIDMLKQSESIKIAASKISESCEKIANGYIRDIEDKINKFDIKIKKGYKKNEV